MNTGKIIVELRDKQGWSQADLASKSGVSRVMIGKYERHDLELLEEDKKKTLLDLIDTYIRDAKGRKAYAS